MIKIKKTANTICWLARMCSNSYSHTVLVGVQTDTTTLKDCHVFTEGAHMHTLWLHVYTPKIGPTDRHAHVYKETYARMSMVALFIKTKRAK